MPLLFRFLAAVLACCAVAGCARAPEPAEAPAVPPNILWITIEDAGPRLGSYGDSVAVTPTLDRLAQEGRRYTHAFATAGVCAPSRAALITGMYQNAIGAHHMRTAQYDFVPGGLSYSAVPPPHVKAFTEYLRAAGYYTANNVKTDYQFAPISDPRQPLTAWDASSTSAHWRGRRPGQPFFAVFNSTRTHESKVWPDPDEPTWTDPARVAVPPYYPDVPEVRRDLARHYDNLRRVDSWVAEILAELDADGLTDSTIVFFFGDHGDGLPRAKRELYDAGLRVPLLIRWPGHLAPGSVDDQLVSFVDLGPTVLSLAGVAVPAHLQGQAFLGTQASAPRRYVYAARDRMDETYDYIRAVRDGRYKYLRNFMPETPYVQDIDYRDRMPTMQVLRRFHAEGRLDATQALWFRPTKPEEELFDVTTDPHEVHDLAADPAYAEVLARMRRALAAWQESIGDMGGIPEAEMVARMWPGGVQPETAVPVIEPAGGALPATVTLRSPTEGASLAYTTDPGEDAHWRLYTGPVTLSAPATLRARAVRYGYRESETATAVFGAR